MIENFINCIDVVHNLNGEPLYLYRGDGQGDYEKVYSRVKSTKLLDDYEEYLITQLEYVRVIREETKV